MQCTESIARVRISFCHSVEERHTRERKERSKGRLATGQLPKSNPPQAYAFSTLVDAEI